MENIMRDKFIAELMGKISDEDLHKVSEVFDVISAKYNITPKSYDMIAYDGSMPQEVQYYIASLRVRELSKLTIRNYMYALNQFFSQVRKPLKDIKTNEINYYLYWYQENRKVSGRSKDKLRQVLNSFFTWCCDNEYLTSNPMRNIKRSKFEVKQRQALTQLELEQVRQACRNVRDSAIVEFFYSTGCRVSELACVKLSDINWQDKSVTLFGKGSKYRTSYINAKCEIALKKYIESRDDSCPYLFVSEHRPHGKISKDGVEEVVRIIESRSGLTKHLTPHVFRHTTATIALQNGMPVTDIQKLLGHANVSTTMVYAETSQENIAIGHKRYVI